MNCKIILLLIILHSFLGCSGPGSKEGSQVRENNLPEYPGLDVLADMHPSEKVEEWLANGDGYSVRKYEISEPSVMANFESSLMKMDSRNLPFGDEIVDDLIFEYIDETDAGSYVLQSNQNDPRDIRLIVLNRSKGELILFESYQ